MLDLLVNIRVKDMGKFRFEVGKKVDFRDLIEGRFTGGNV